ncbi:MAG: RecX family transcriptional regulator [Bacteroidales bacterium]|nr:RecX family transcriptional regulator [Bacteroidales bacterium]
MKDKLLDRLRRQCSRREYCSADILKKAGEALDGDREGAKEILEVLVAEKYVDDLRYATAYAREKSMISGWGGTKIGYVLSGKGIPRETISLALAEIDEARAGQRLERLMAAKAKSLKDDPQARLKLLRFGLGRGYQYDEVVDVIDKYKTDK